MKTYDTIVLGAGSMGMPTALNLAKRGQSVLIIDKYDVPHSFGSHHGETRMLRVAYTEGAAYVPLVKRARELWLKLEELGGQAAGSIFAPVGALNIMPPTSASKEELDACVQEYGLPYERLSARDATKRWTGLAVPQDSLVHYDPQGGVVFSEAGLRTFKTLALDAGVDFQIGTVEHLVVGPSEATVWMNGESISAAHLVITTGAATRQIFDQWFPDWLIPLQPTRKVIAWYEGSEEDLNSYQAPEFPAYSIETERGWYYGFPDFGGGVKVGRHDGGTPCDPHTLDRTCNPGDDEELELRWLMQNYLPHAFGHAKRASVCMYNMTPDEHFVIDTHPEFSHVVLASGFSGHGFKFAPAIAEVLCQLVTDGRTEYDISLFRAGRFTNRL